MSQGKCAPYLQLKGRINEAALLPRTSLGLLQYYLPTDLARLYAFPEPIDGSGQKIGVIELGGSYLDADMTFFHNSIIKVVEGSNARFATITPVTFNNTSKVWESGVRPPFLNDNSANGEVALDLQIICAAAPGAQVYVYFIDQLDDTNTNPMATAVNKAVLDGCSVISISWGLYESGWSANERNATDAAFLAAVNANVTVLVASGDSGSLDGANVPTADYPASSPNVVACGGTNLLVNLLSGGSLEFISETVWNNNNGWATGGGYSAIYNKPVWQTSAQTKRGVPDVAGHADPNQIPYIVRMNNGNYSSGGTSAVSPLYAALVARLNQARPSFLNGPILNQLIANNYSTVCRDILVGNNDTQGGTTYAASSNWDACSGYGSLKGAALREALLLLPTPTPTPTANFTVSATNKKTVTFTNTTVVRAGTTYTWNFGTNSTYTRNNNLLVQRTFPAYRQYTVTLRATYNNSTTSKSVVVNLCPATATANFTFIKTKAALVLETWKFTNTTSYDTSKTAPTYSWNFGTGRLYKTASKTITIKLNRNISYNVSLTATSLCGGVTTKTVAVVG